MALSCINCTTCNVKCFSYKPLLHLVTPDVSLSLYPLPLSFALLLPTRGTRGQVQVDMPP